MKKKDYRQCGFEMIAKPIDKKTKNPSAGKIIAKRDLRVKGG